jgi:ribosomal protein L37E
MGFLQRFLRKDPPAETTCSRCGTPAPEGSMECTACGWDLREMYHESEPTPAA